jgi:hypothetical protein
MALKLTLRVESDASLPEVKVATVNTDYYCGARV